MSTTRFRDAIAEMRLRHGGSARDISPSRLAKVVNTLPDDIGNLRPPKDYDALSHKLVAMLRDGEVLQPRQARDGAWCLWGTAEEITANPATLQSFLRQMYALKHKGASRALALSYLINFHETRPELPAIAATLRDLAQVAGEPFQTLADRFRIFDVDDGPKRLGEASVHERKAPGTVLQGHGLEMEIVLSGGYVEASTRRALEHVVKDGRFSPEDRLEFVNRISVTPGASALTFPGHKHLVADALLLPYQTGQPDKALRDKILNFLMSLQGIGDPRTHSGNWVNMPQARDIAISWLTEQALRQFLDIVGAVNPNENWHYRRRFWETIYNNGAISAAWVVLDRLGTYEARRRFGRNTQFAEFEGGGVQAGHAVLLLRIGSGVCAEWSFDGKCRFWSDYSRDGAPQLFMPRYDADFLRSGRAYFPALEITHIPHTGANAWQHKAARQIQKMTGLRFSPREYLG